MRGGLEELVIPLLDSDHDSQEGGCSDTCLCKQRNESKQSESNYTDPDQHITEINTQNLFHNLWQTITNNNSNNTANNNNNYNNNGNILCQSCLEYDDRKAITYESFLNQIDQYANAFWNIGVRCHDTISISLPTTPQALIAMMAVNKIGATASMLNPHLPTEAIKKALCISNSKFLLCQSSLPLPLSLTKTLVRTAIVCMSPLDSFSVTELRERLGVNTIELPRFLQNGQCVQHIPVSSSHRDFTALILYNSQLQGVMLSNNAIICNARNIAKILKSQQSSKHLLSTPLYNQCGIITLISNLLVGCHTIFMHDFDLYLFERIIRRSNITHIVGSGTMLATIVSSNNIHQNHLKSLEILMSPDAVCSSVYKSFDKLLQSSSNYIGICHIYGTPECFPMLTNTSRYFSCDVLGWCVDKLSSQIIFDKSHTEAEILSCGELCVTGPGIMMSYCREPDASSIVLQTHDETTWLHTGVQVCGNQSGCLSRKSNDRKMTVCGCEIYPAEIEAMFLQHKAVKTAEISRINGRMRWAEIQALITLETGVADSFQKLLCCQCEQFFGVACEIVIRCASENTSDGIIIDKPDAVLSANSLGDLFKQMIARKPGSQPAVLYDKQTITYQDLDRYASNLASYLQLINVHRNTVVGVYLPRGINVLISMYGVWLAGASYLPLDSKLAHNRIQFMLQDTSTQVLITCRALIGQIKPYFTNQIVCIDELDLTVKRTLQSVPSDPTDIAYIIYTSGSTGTPKGCLIQQSNALSAIQAFDDMNVHEENARVFSVCSLSFDGCMSDLVLYFLTGASLVMSKEVTEYDIAELASCFQRFQITDWECVPSVMNMITTWVLSEKSDQQNQTPGRDYLPRSKLLSSLRTVGLGGEKFSQKLAAKMRACLSDNCKIINFYGPTETTITTCWFEIPPSLTIDDNSSKGLPIGQPGRNVLCYIVDDNMQLCPQGISGQLCIGGPQVTVGYLRQPELTKKKFIPNPFAENSGNIYLTGDIAYRNSSGQLQFVGRSDNQIKMNGLRIELGEIETACVSCVGITDAMVIFDNNMIVAFVSPSSVNVEAVRHSLSDILPSYMIPSHIIKLDHFPLLANQKIDRKALRKKAREHNKVLSSARVAPSSPLEEKILNLWAQCISVDISQVNMLTDIFSSGGSSLHAISFATQLRANIDTSISVSDVLSARTIGSVARYVASNMSGKHKRKQNRPRIDVGIDLSRKLFECSFAQQQMWLLKEHSTSQTSQIAYNVCLTMSLKGVLNEDKLLLAMERVHARHSSLRSNLCYNPNISSLPMQQISDVSSSIHYKRSDCLYGRSKHDVMQQLISDFSYIFDISKQMCQYSLYHIDEEEYVLNLVFHHTCIDGYSLGILMNELRIYYINPDDVSLAYPVPYQAFSEWQAQWKQTSEYNHQLQYWQEQLEDVNCVLSLPSDYPRPAVLSNNGDTLETTLNSHTVSTLCERALQWGVTEFAVVIAAYGLVLGTFSGQQDVLVGSPVANRMTNEFEGIMGNFVNTIPIRVNWQPRNDDECNNQPCDFEQLVKRVFDWTVCALANQEVPFVDVVNALSLPRDNSRGALIQTMLSLDKWEVGGSHLLGETMQSELIRVKNNTSMFEVGLDIIMNIHDTTSKQCELLWNWNPDIFCRKTIERFARTYNNVLTRALENPHILADELVVASDTDLVWLNSVHFTQECDYTKSLGMRFLQAVTDYSDKIAVIYEDQSITYKELGMRSCSLAGFLQSQGVQPNNVVAMHLKRGIDVYVAIWGIWLTGASYLPMDAKIPVSRLQFMLTDASAHYLITSTDLSPPLMSIYSGQLICIDELDLTIERTLRSVPYKPTDIAYIIYTSGSSGTPKGCLVEQYSALQYALYVFEDVNIINQNSRAFCMTSPSFDGSMDDYVMYILAGAMNIVSKEIADYDIPELVACFEKYQITNWEGVPSVMNMIVDWVLAEKSSVQNQDGGRDYYPRSRALASLRLLSFGGEKFTDAFAVKLRTVMSPQCRIINFYGPTEATVAVTGYEIPFNVTESKSTGNGAPIGTPGLGVLCYVVNQKMQLVPPGVSGQLLLGGPQIALGYLNRPEITNEKFMNNPFDIEAGRVYKTGDVVFWNVHGQLEFVGRMDNQIKMNGLRIELGEIENALSNCSGVGQAIVLYDNILKQITAFITPQMNDMTDITSQLSLSLPSYMVPTQMLSLDRLPLTNSQKIDQKALLQLAIAHRNTQSKSQRVAPSSPLEKNIVDLWAKCLSVESSDIDISTDLFASGGNSLNVILFASQLRNTIHGSISVRDVLVGRTIHSIAKHIEAAQIKEQSKKALPYHNQQKESVNQTVQQQEEEEESDKEGVITSDCSQTVIDTTQLVQHPQQHTKTVRMISTVLQLIGMLFLLLQVSISMAPSGLLFLAILYAPSHGLELYLRFFSVSLCSFAFSAVICLSFSYITKMVLLRKAQPGRYALWSGYFLRWWLVDRSMSLTRWCVRFITKTRLLNTWYRCMGANIGNNNSIGSFKLSDLDLITIGDNCTIGKDVVMRCSTIIGDELVLEQICIGSNTILETGAVITAPITISPYSIIQSMSHPSFHGKFENSRDFYAGHRRQNQFTTTPLSSSAMRYCCHLACVICVIGVSSAATAIPIFLLYLCPLSAQLFCTLFPLCSIVSSLIYFTFCVIYKIIIIGKLQPGFAYINQEDGSLKYKYWLFEKLIDHPLYRVLLDCVGFTPVLPLFYSMLGFKVHYSAMMSPIDTIWYDLVKVEEDTTLCSNITVECMASTDTEDSTLCELREVKFGARSFVGDCCVLESGSTVGKNTALGSLSTVEEGHDLPENSTWVGIPPMCMLEGKADVVEKLSSIGSLMMWSTLHLLSLLTAIVSVFCAPGYLCAYILYMAYSEGLPWQAYLLVTPIVIVAYLIQLLLANIFILRCFCHFQPGTYNQRGWNSIRFCVSGVLMSTVNVVMNFMAYTPFIILFYRSLGADISIDACINVMSEPAINLLKIGSKVTVNEDARLDCHAFDNGLMTLQGVCVSRGASIGTMSVLQAGTALEEYVVFEPNTLALKAEYYHRKTVWEGSPARNVETQCLGFV